MGRTLNKLSARKVSTLKTPGYHSDGGGLYLQVSSTLSKSWIFKFVRDKKATEVGLGSLVDVSLEHARDKAADYRKLLKQGINPLAEKRKIERDLKLSVAKAMTFADCAEAYIEVNRHGWKNPKHAQQWTNTLMQYAYPVFGKLPVAEIDTPLVVKCLEPIWTSKNETASRLRGRIETVLDWATVTKYREGENPARWRGHLDKILPKPSKVQKVEHHAALPYAEIAVFMAKLRSQTGVAAKCLEFTILTATRTNESIGATWAEIDLSNKTWTIPGERMKAGRAHRIPLSERVVDILLEMQQVKINDFIFPGTKKGLSNMAMLQLLKRMGDVGLTVHGFRSSFRDWAAETTSYPSEVVEMALAHTIKNQAEAAYRRGDLMEKRSQLMTDWQVFCAT